MTSAAQDVVHESNVVSLPYETDADVPASDWRIETPADADWALERLGDFERQKKENVVIGQTRVEAILFRVSNLNDALEKKAAFFRQHLIAYAQAHRAELIIGKKKSRDFPSGTIAYRKTGGGLVVKDKSVLLDWARKQPVELNFVRIKEEPAVDEIKLASKTSGEVPEGMEYEPEAEVIKLEPKVAEVTT